MTTSSSRKLLIVDDDPIARRAIARTLADKDYEIVQAESPSRALELMQEHHFRVLITDQHMPGSETGTDFLAMIEILFPDTIRILLTSDTSTEVFVAAINGGKARRVVYKPWHDEQLHNVVRQSFGLPRKRPAPPLKQPTATTLTRIAAMLGVSGVDAGRP